MKTICGKCEGRGVYPQDNKIITCDKCLGARRIDMTEQEEKQFKEYQANQTLACTFSLANIGVQA